MQPGIVDGPVAIIAGGGGLPGELADALVRAGRPLKLLALRGFAERALARRADALHDLLDVDGMLARLDAWQPAAIMLAGIVHRPRPSAAMNAFAAFRNRERVAQLIEGGDDRLLVNVISLIEERGFRVAGIDQIAPDLLAPEGTLTARHPKAADQTDIATGFKLLDAVSPFDMGQAAIVGAGRVLAIEGPEGTDAMLKRVGGLWRTARLRRREPGGVLVKTAKRGQDLRVDLPVIGPRTLVRLAAARLDGIAVGAGRTLILEREKTIAEANRRGLFIIGVSPESLS